MASITKTSNIRHRRPARSEDDNPSITSASSLANSQTSNHGEGNTSSSEKNPQLLNNTDSENSKSDSTKPQPYKKTAKPIWPTLNAGITTADIVISLSLLLLAFAVRVYKLTSPAQVIFDEMHYIKFSNWILQGKFFFDVNPYFGKIVITGIAHLAGYNPNLFAEPNPEDPYPDISLAWAGRLPAAILGSLSVMIFYRLCRQLRVSRVAASFGAFCMLFDTMNVVQSRMNMVDIVLVFFTTSAMCCALILWDAKKIVIVKRRHLTIWDVVNVAVYLLGAGVLSGMAVAVRWTAFATPLAIVIVSMFGVPPFCQSPLNSVEMILLVGSMFGTYFATFALLFYLTPNSGSGDVFMSKGFQACLNGSKQQLENIKLYGSRKCEMNVWQRFVELNKVIFRYSKIVRGGKASGPTWYQWIVNWRGTLYHRTQHGKEAFEAILLLMNPAMVLLVDVAIICFIVGMCLTIRYRRTYRISEATKASIQRAAMFLLSWILSMLPTMVVYRAGPVYQYLPGLIFAQAAASVAFDMLPTRIGPIGGVRMITLLISLTLMIASFWYWGAWVYSVPLSIEEHRKRQWLSGWKL